MSYPFIVCHPFHFFVFVCSGIYIFFLSFGYGRISVGLDRMLSMLRIFRITEKNILYCELI